MNLHPNFHVDFAVQQLIQSSFWRVVQKGQDTSLNQLLTSNRFIAYLMVNYTNMNGPTSIALASYWGRTNTVRLLLEAQASTVSRRHWMFDNQTPLIMAALKGHKGVLEALLDAQVNVNEIDEHGNTALIYAANKGRYEFVEQLLKAHADVNVVNQNGYTALHGAASNGYNHILQLLIEAGADVNVRTYQLGQTPLIVAAEHGCADGVWLLIAAGADVNVADSVERNTALMYAAKSGRVQLVRLLVNAGAHIHFRNESFQCAADIARINGHIQVLEELKQRPNSGMKGFLSESFNTKDLSRFGLLSGCIIC